MTPDLMTFVILTLAVYRLSRLVVEDAVLEPLRTRVWAKFPPSNMIGYWFTCYWCTSIWFATLVVVSYTIVPVPTMFVSLILALSAITGIIAARVDR